MKPLKFKRTDYEGVYEAQVLLGTYRIRRYQEYYNLHPRPATYTYWRLDFIPVGESGGGRIEIEAASLRKRDAVAAAHKHHEQLMAEGMSQADWVLYGAERSSS